MYTIKKSTTYQAALADFSLSLEWRELPVEAVNHAKLLLADTFAAMIAGSGAPGIKIVIDQIRDWGGNQQASIAQFGDRVPAPMAALANAAMAHALDYDDTLDESKLHGNVCVVPAALAAADLAGGVSGQEFLLAHAVGLEISSRLSLAAGSNIQPGWLPTTVFGIFGATAAAARLLRLSLAQTQHAFGIAYNFAGGNRQGVMDGALTKRIQPALYAQAAVTSVQLALRGMTGPYRAIDGECGLYPLFVGNGYELSRITSDLGKEFEFLNIGIKPYPCCRYSHQAIDASLAITKKNRVIAGDIKRVNVYLGSQAAFDFVGKPFQVRSFPQVDAQFSVAFCVASALLRGSVSLNEFKMDWILSPEIKCITDRVHVMVDPALDGTVEVESVQGAQLIHRALLPKGHPGCPMSADEMRAKFTSCAEAAVRPLGINQVDQLFEMLGEVQRIPDISALLQISQPSEVSVS